MLILVATIIAGGATILYQIDDNLSNFGTLFLRRYTFVPAYLNFMYWDYFSSNPFAFWSDSKVSFGLVEPVYGRPTPQVIGDYYSGVDFSNTEQRFNNANTGWLGSGYGNAGFIGMLVYSVISGVVVRSINVLGEAVGDRVAISAMGFYFYAIFFTSTDLPAALVSYGFIPMVVAALLWRRFRFADNSKTYVH
jgi:hypothetical protein